MLNLKTLFKPIHYKFWELHSTLLKENKKFKDIHSGDTCIIVANGGSLKYHDFSKLSGIPAIGCSYTLLDKRVKRLNINYVIFSDPYELMPIIFNKKTRGAEGVIHHKTVKRIQIKFYSKLFKRFIKEYPNITFFASLTNAYSSWLKPHNLFYFNYCKRNKMDHNISGQFSYTDGALHVMIGVAKYLGFKKIILLGCDYLGIPKLEGHFYSNSPPFIGKPHLSYCTRIKQLCEGLDVLFVSVKGIQSPVFSSAVFSEIFGGEELYQSNTEIISREDLLILNSGVEKIQIYM